MSGYSNIVEYKVKKSTISSYELRIYDRIILINPFKFSYTSCDEDALQHYNTNASCGSIMQRELGGGISEICS